MALPAVWVLLAVASGLTSAPAAASPLSPEPAAAPDARAAASAAVPDGVPSEVESIPGTRTPLSDEQTLSRWAYVREKTKARAVPYPGAEPLRQLRTTTEDRTPELVLLLSELRTENDGTWVEVRLPMRPNGTTGWVRREALGAYQEVATQLRINRRHFTARLFRDGEQVWRGRIGVGKHGSPTPRGRFYVRERLVPRRKDSVYGIFAFGTSAYSATLTDWPGGGVVGIHGTNKPKLIPGRISHGCVRIRNYKVGRLKRIMPLGTPIEIK